MRSLAISLALVWAGIAFAEASAPAGAAQQPGTTAGNSGYGPNNYNYGPSFSKPSIWDDKVFDLPKTDVNPKSDRYQGDPPSYTSEQRDQWLENCAAVKEDPKAYRECFNGEKKKSAKNLRESFERVERKQSEPFRSAPNPDLESPRTPAELGSEGVPVEPAD
jgi:hypothetical protein